MVPPCLNFSYLRIPYFSSRTEMPKDIYEQCKFFLICVPSIEIILLILFSPSSIHVNKSFLNSLHFLHPPEIVLMYHNPILFTHPNMLDLKIKLYPPPPKKKKKIFPKSSPAFVAHKALGLNCSLIYYVNTTSKTK